MVSGILLSGGLDSTALAYWKRPHIGFFVNYGQAAAMGEAAAAGAVAEDVGIELHRIDVDLRLLGSGEMALRPSLRGAPTPEWWPYRNQMLVTLALMKGASLGLTELMCGSVVSDRASADGSPAFWEMLASTVRVQEGQVRVTTPAIELTTSQLIIASLVPAEILAWTISCHRGPQPCGECRGCLRRRESLLAAGFDLY